MQMQEILKSFVAFFKVERLQVWVDIHDKESGIHISLDFYAIYDVPALREFFLLIGFVGMIELGSTSQEGINLD